MVAGGAQTDSYLANSDIGKHSRSIQERGLRARGMLFVQSVEVSPGIRVYTHVNRVALLQRTGGGVRR